MIRASVKSKRSEAISTDAPMLAFAPSRHFMNQSVVYIYTGDWLMLKTNYFKNVIFLLVFYLQVFDAWKSVISTWLDIGILMAT